MKNEIKYSEKLKGIFLVLLIAITMLGNVPANMVVAEEYTSGVWQEIALNNLHPLLDTPKERKALSNLVDRHWIVDTYLEVYPDSYTYPSVTIYLDYFTWYNSKLQPVPDASKNTLRSIDKMEILIECSEEPEMTVMVPSSNSLRIDWAIDIVSTWNDNGYCIDLVAMDWFDNTDPGGGIVFRSMFHETLFDDDPSTTIPTFENLGYDMVFLGYGFEIRTDIDPIIDGHLDEMYTYGNPENFYQYSCILLDNLITNYKKVGGNKGLAYAIQNILAETVPAIILFISYDTYG